MVAILLTEYGWRPEIMGCVFLTSNVVNRLSRWIKELNWKFQLIEYCLVTPLTVLNTMNNNLEWCYDLWKPGYHLSISRCVAKQFFLVSLDSHDRGLDSIFVPHPLGRLCRDDLNEKWRKHVSRNHLSVLYLHFPKWKKLVEEKC